MRNIYRNLFIIILIVLLLPYVFGKPRGNIFFNQDQIDELDIQHDYSTVKERFQRQLSRYTARLNSIINSGTVENVDYENVESVFGFLFRSLPYYVIVHPTEMYYYYRFKMPDKTVSGNIRLVEARNGRIGVGYFDVDAPQEKGQHKLFGPEDGVWVRQVSQSIYRVSYHGKSVYFQLSDLAAVLPRDVKLIDGEQFVARVRDESGVVLYLIYNENPPAFYYLRSEDRALLEKHLQHGEQILVGERSGFAYLDAKSDDRRILIGVSSKSISKNDYYDGPFDQVPPNLNLKPMINRVYPYTKLSQVDKYGNFLGRSSTRVAISSYKKYRSLVQLQKHLDACLKKAPEGPVLWECLVFEKKRDFHKQSGAFTPEGELRSKSD